MTPARLGRYEILRRLGRGATGEVWEAVLHGPAGFRKPVALKRLRPDLAAERASSLQREARLGAWLQHPNVVAIFALERVEAQWCVVMELVRGRSLAALLRRGPLAPRAILDVGVQACAGLEAIHALAGARLVHRDVKPGNLLVDGHGTVKVADLGIAAAAGGPGDVAGTPGFMAPEQAAGRPEPRSDLFSLGCTLATCATGHPPFGVGWDAIAAAVRSDGRLGEVVASVDAAVPGLGEVVRRCLRRDPADRWATAGELGAALAALRTRHRGAGVEAPEVPSPPARATPEPTQDLARGNLPASRDRFFGREPELAELLVRIRAHARLVTVLGPGGTGKTRLSIEAARSVARELHGGAWFFDLSDARTVDGICTAMAVGLSLQLDRDDPVAHVGRALAAKGRAVVLLDNLEQVAAHADATVRRWVDGAPDATFVVTSRVALKVPGEERCAVGPLEVADGVRLLRDRVLRPLPDPDEALERVVAALEGLPLAIELVAARLRVLPLDEVARGLDERLRLLSGGDRDRPERHRSLRASLDGSFELLPAWGRAALAQLSVFEGGFTVEAAEAVLDPSASPPGGWALDALEGLVDASLLRFDEARGRFVMLVAVAQYAAERATPAERSATELRHGAYFGQFGAPAALDVLEGPRAAEARPALARELDNLVAACRRAIARGDAGVAIDTLRAAWAVMAFRGPPGFAEGLAGTLLALPGLPDGVRWLAHRVAGDACRNAGREADARAHYERVLAVGHATGSRRAVASAHQQLGTLALERGRNAEARGHYEEALRTWDQLGDRRNVGVMLANLGIARAQQDGPSDEALALMEGGLAAHREVSNRWLEAIDLGHIGVLYAERGDRATARRYYEACLPAVRAMGDHLFEAVMLDNVASLEAREGRLVEALAANEAATALVRAVGVRRVEGGVLSHRVPILRRLGRCVEARHHGEVALALLREVGDVRREVPALVELAVVAAECGAHAEAGSLLDAADERARTLTSDGSRRAIVLVGRAEVAALRGQLAAAREALAAAEGLAHGDARAELDRVKALIGS